VNRHFVESDVNNISAYRTVCNVCCFRHDFTATLGQTTVSELIVKGDTITRRAKLFSTRPWEVSVRLM
jgi:hypothetical protein